MLSMDVVEHAHTEWASLIVLVPKKDRTTRFCADYCRLKAVTIWICT